MKGPKLLVALLVGVAFFAVSPLAGAEEDLLATLMERENALWKGWAEADVTPFEAHMHDGAIGLNPGGMSVGKAESIADITSGECTVRSWELGEATLHMLKEDVAIVTYTADQDATCGEHEIGGKANVASLWVRMDGDWKAAGYFEAPAGE